MKRGIAAFTLFFLFGSLITGCETSDPSEAGTTGTDTSNTDIEGDADGSDADSDSDSDADSDSDSDTDSDSDSGCEDNDGDAWCEEFDCDDDDPNINPNIEEIEDNGVDDDCDGQTDEVDTDPECGEEEFTIEPVPIRMMILQDISGSMGDDGKWTQAKAALTAMLTDFSDSIDFGFDVFPNGSPCFVADPVVSDTLPGNAGPIIDLFAPIVPGGGTPLAVGMKNFLITTPTAYAPLFMDEEADSYLVVVSDGRDTCRADGSGNGTSLDPGATPAELAQITTQLLTERQIKTFVIGFGLGVDPTQLNAIAAAGGTSFTQYFDAANQTDLEAALNSIGSEVVSCEYDVTIPDDADEDEVNFYFDSVVLVYNQDCQDPAASLDVGWTWIDVNTKNRIQFCDESCAQLPNVSVVQAKFGCPTETP